MIEELVDEVIAIPETDAEELVGSFPFDGLFETSPTDEKAELSIEILHGSDELIENDPLDG